MYLKLNTFLKYLKYTYIEHIINLKHLVILVKTLLMSVSPMNVIFFSFYRIRVADRTVKFQFMTIYTVRGDQIPSPLVKIQGKLSGKYNLP